MRHASHGLTTDMPAASLGTCRVTAQSSFLSLQLRRRSRQASGVENPCAWIFAITASAGQRDAVPASMAHPIPEQTRQPFKNLHQDVCPCASRPAAARRPIAVLPASRWTGTVFRQPGRPATTERPHLDSPVRRVLHRFGCNVGIETHHSNLSGSIGALSCT